MNPTSHSASASILPLSRLVRVVRRLRRQGKIIAFTNGCFDLLHIGHIDYLERVKSKADCLIVGVNSDSSVRRLKGPGRPVVPARERARVLASLKPVDYVTIFSELTPFKVIRAVQPDLLAKGADWRRKAIVGGDLVLALGGKVVAIHFLRGHSTTRIFERIRRL